MAIRSVEIGCIDYNFKPIAKSVYITTCNPWDVEIKTEKGKSFRVAGADLLAALELLGVTNG